MKKKILYLLIITLSAFFTYSCANKMAADEKSHKTQNHDKDGDGHGGESENHDKDKKPHASENKERKGEHSGGEHSSRERGEHSKRGESSDSERGEHARDKDGSGEGEEDGTEFSLDERYDQVRNGARLVLMYDATSNSFVGTVKNITNKELKNVRIEVHLSNGLEIGPTKSIDIGPGVEKNVTLKASEAKFERWSTHAEVGNNEHGGKEEHDGDSDEHN